MHTHRMLLACVDTRGLGAITSTYSCRMPTWIYWLSTLQLQRFCSCLVRCHAYLPSCASLVTCCNLCIRPPRACHKVPTHTCCALPPNPWVQKLCGEAICCTPRPCATSTHTTAALRSCCLSSRRRWAKHCACLLQALVQGQPQPQLPLQALAAEQAVALAPECPWVQRRL